ncbi:excalibur calcium-binding domain-containing protein [Actinomyces capricornis]|uniref:PASTA domain-containing protein n=1 Tax=Actinomyces capricornis TaxID=2755559 RepID=A0ABN6K9V4_9ACTO|nr:excalibur calcium-binding domain-containing protein [Actinomyces capricornis]BDA65148.1 hypothetical protein MANAM107_19820 [Actinomyces capricornis]
MPRAFFLPMVPSLRHLRAACRPDTWLQALALASVVILSLILSGCGSTEAAGRASQAPSASQEATVTVPEVVGMKGDAAVEALEAAGLTRSPTFKDADGQESVWKKSNWSVVTQDPAAGTAVPADQEVTLMVNHDSADAAATQSAEAEASRQAAEKEAADKAAAEQAAAEEASRQAAEQAAAEKEAADRAAAEQAAQEAEQQNAQEAPAPVAPAAPAAEFYGSCKEARAAGAAPLYAGDPGYRLDLDRDGDGIACEVK